MMKRRIKKKDTHVKKKENSITHLFLIYLLPINNIILLYLFVEKRHPKNIHIIRKDIVLYILII